MIQQGEQLVSDFTVRIYERPDSRCRVEVTGNHTGITASDSTGGRGIQWLFALVRALKTAGAYPLKTP